MNNKYTTNNYKFQMAALKEKKKFKDFVQSCKRNCIAIRKFSDDPFEPWDVSFHSGSTESNFIALGEIKVRDFNMERYSSAILEEQKIRNIYQKRTTYELQYKVKLRVFYFAFYRDGVAIWDLDKLNDTTIGFHLCPKHTCGDGRMIRKKCYEFYFNKAEEIWKK